MIALRSWSRKIDLKRRGTFCLLNWVTAFSSDLLMSEMMSTKIRISFIRTQEEYFLFSNENAHLGLFCADCFESGNREAEAIFTYSKGNKKSSILPVISEVTGTNLFLCFSVSSFPLAPSPFFLCSFFPSPARLAEFKTDHVPAGKFWAAYWRPCCLIYKTWTGGISLTGLLWGLNELIHIKYLESPLACSEV